MSELIGQMYNWTRNKEDTWLKNETNCRATTQKRFKQDVSESSTTETLTDLSVAKNRTRNHIRLQRRSSKL